MVRVVNALNLLQTTLFDASMMITQRHEPREIVKMINKRFTVLINPPSYIKIDWDNDSHMMKGNNYLNELEEKIEGLFQ